MKSLGELGYENLKPGLVRFFIVQFLGKLEEERPNRAAIQALHDYWIPLLRDERERHACWEEFKCLYSKQKVLLNHIDIEYLYYILYNIICQWAVCFRKLSPQNNVQMAGKPH